MRRLHTCTKAGTYRINGMDRNLAVGDTADLSAKEAGTYEREFGLADDWNLVVDDVTLDDTAGLTATRTFLRDETFVYDFTGKKLEDKMESIYKSVTVVADVTLTMPIGARINFSVIGEDGSVLETKTEVLPETTDTSVARTFTSSFMNNKEKSYVVEFIAPPAGGGLTYDLDVEVIEYIPAEVKHVLFASDGIDGTDNVVTVSLLDENGDGVGNFPVDLYIASSSSGVPASAAVMNDIDATVGDIVEFAEDQYVTALSDGATGNIVLDLEPADAGTPTETVLTFGDVPIPTDNITFGDLVFEFIPTPSDVPTIAGAIGIPITGGMVDIVDVTTTATMFVEYFMVNTPYDVIATSAVGVVTLTAFKHFVDYNSLATTTDFTTPGDALYEDATFGGGAAASVTGINPATFYYVACRYAGKTVVSPRLPWEA